MSESVDIQKQTQTPTIKFRAWQPHNKRMMDTPYGDEFLGEGTPINLAIRSCEEDGQVLMQFTGLKDRDGTEVYEGDLVQFRFRTAEQNKLQVGEIFMDDYMWCVRSVEDYSINRINDVLVIGNKFEGVR